MTEIFDRDLNNLKKEDINKLFDWIFHEDELFVNRINFFLLAESILFAAIISSSGSDKKIILLVVILGFIFSIVWALISYFHIKNVIEPMQDELKKINYLYYKFNKKRGRSWRYKLYHRCMFSSNIIGCLDMYIIYQVLSLLEG